MHRWLVALVVSTVATGSAVAVNIATELKHNIWAWLAVGVLTVVGAVVTVWMQRVDARSNSPRDVVGAAQPTRGTANVISGGAGGQVVQAGQTGVVTFGPAPVTRSHGAVVNHHYYGDARPEGSAPAADPVAAERVSRPWNVPLQNPNFTGRDELLERLHRDLCADGAVAVRALRGMGGVGKTQLVTEYAHRFADEYELVWWIPAEQPGLIPNHLARLGPAMGVPDTADVAAAAEQVVAVLRDRSRWLLIFDNAEDPDALRPYLPGRNGHVLITTRRPGFTGLGHVLDVDVLPREESVALLHRRIPDLTDAQAQELAQVLGDLPLALEQAAAYLEATGLPVADYLALMTERAEDMLDAGMVFGYEHTLATVWSLSVGRITEQPAAGALLDLCAYLAPEAIPLDLFTQHHDHLPPALQTAVTDPKSWADTVGVLVDYALIRREADTISLHRLLQTALRHRHLSVPTTDALDSAATVQTLLRADLPTTIQTAPENWSRWRALLPHVLACTNTSSTDTPPPDPDTTTWLLDRAATYLRVHGQSAQALPLFERALAITETTHGPNHPDIANQLNNLGHALRDLGQSARALPLFERALTITETSYGPNHPDIANRLSSLGRTLRDLGQPARALPLFERALTITETSYGPNHPDIAHRLSSLARTLRDLGQSARALPLFERALTITETTYGPNHPDIAYRLNNVGRTLRNLGQPTQALPLFERALTITHTTYGPNHPYIAYRLSHLGLTLRELGQATQALSLFERALAITETTYGPNHPDIAKGLNDLALTLRDLGQSAQAFPLFERALTIAESTYGPDHPTSQLIRRNLKVLDG